MLISSRKLIFTIFLICTLFFLGLIFDITPWIRGPQDSLLPVRWPYYFVNTFSKIWAPLLTFAIFITGFFIVINKKPSKKQELYLLSFLVVLIFFFQLSLVYFSRFGLNVLFRRMVDPGINGYFSTAVKIKDVPQFISNFPQEVIKLDQHARGHPPGSVLIIKNGISFFENNKKTTSFLYSLIPKPKGDSLKLWKNLTIPQRATAIFYAFFLHFLAALTIIPFYFLAKSLFDQKTAIWSVFLYSIIPSLSFFAMLFDPFYLFFPLLTFIFLNKFLETKKNFPLIFSGFIFGLGLFFSMSIFPFAFILFLYAFLSERNIKNLLKAFSLWFVGFLFVQLLFYLLFKYDFIASLSAVVRYQLPREYAVSLLSNPYDFFIYIGLPISLLFFYLTYKSFRLKKNNLFISFWTVFILLTISGISRGEVGRIWLSLMPIPILLVADFSLKNLKLKRKEMIFLLVLSFIQVILMEEYWVPIW